jgi:hypothetical protein
VSDSCVRSQSFPLLPTHSRCRGCLFSLDHSQTHTTFGRTPLDEGSARRRDLYLTTQTLTRDKNPCPPVGFEPTIPASARPQTYAVDRAATGIDWIHVFRVKITIVFHYVTDNINHDVKEIDVMKNFQCVTYLRH